MIYCYGYICGKKPKEIRRQRKVGDESPKAPAAPKTDLKNLIPYVKEDIVATYVNKSKGTFVVKWRNGTTTKLTLQNGDIWDSEKAMAIALVKHYLSNDTGEFNELFKEFCD